LDDGHVSFGVRISDDYDDYVNDYIVGDDNEALTELPFTKEGLVMLLIKLDSQKVDDMLDLHSTNEGGAYIIDNWIDGNELDELISTARNILLEKEAKE
jgi:hypothetical protein